MEEELRVSLHLTTGEDKAEVLKVCRCQTTQNVTNTDSLASLELQPPIRAQGPINNSSSKRIHLYVQ